MRMDFGQFLDKNAGAIFAVIGTMGGALVGTLVTSFFNLRQKKAEWINQKKLRLLERSIDFEERYLIRPIVEYIEAELQILQRIYSRVGDKEPALPPEMYQDQFWKMLATEARVEVYGNAELIEKFKAFTRKRIEMGNSIFDPANKNRELAYQDLQEAKSIAVGIWATLKARLSDF